MPNTKVLVTSRRKPGLTREEVHEYFHQIHGALAQSPDPNHNPSKYTQFHFYDSVCHADADHQAVADIGAELYFESEQHLLLVFQSAWVRENVSPDNLNFSDTKSTCLRITQEKVISLGGAAIEAPMDCKQAAPVAILRPHYQFEPFCY
ncbi:EthD domain-containing protein [Fusarium falciforme]|uniref:EthD domain-containing protein n=1 Tax=Fusarium falciforme TaxID=195108 RepID=UPI0023012DF2|nr:EthD domain-containing protein [Fusarium falciforme]WAO94471.1 EthD domain-containing protein [Fusarium falciforme]